MQFAVCFDSLTVAAHTPEYRSAQGLIVRREPFNRLMGTAGRIPQSRSDSRSSCLTARSHASGGNAPDWISAPATSFTAFTFWLR